MGSRSSKLERQSEDSGASGSHKVSKKPSKENENLREEHTDITIKDANLNVVDRKPLDKRDPWGHMAAVVHSKHGV
jgi:hypothetical protein